MTGEIVETAVNIELKPGSFSLHDAYVIHGSEPNRSSDFRKNYTMHYADADTTKFRPEKWRIPFFLSSGPSQKPYILYRHSSASTVTQPTARLPTGKKPKKDNDGKILRAY